MWLSLLTARTQKIAHVIGVYYVCVRMCKCTCGATQRVRTWFPRGKCAQHLQTCVGKTDRRWKKMFACARWVMAPQSFDHYRLQAQSIIILLSAMHGCVCARRGVSALACTHLSYITMLSFGARPGSICTSGGFNLRFLPSVCVCCIAVRSPYTPVHVCLKLG